MRLVRTRVLPEPGPARTLTGPRGAVTAACCDVLRFSKYLIYVPFYISSIKNRCVIDRTAMVSSDTGWCLSKQFALQFMSILRMSAPSSRNSNTLSMILRRVDFRQWQAVLRLLVISQGEYGKPTVVSHWLCT